jgi:hypothetical protein
LRGRSGRKGPNPLTRSFESNGPDVKIRGTAQHVAEKYLQLARDAQSSGDIVMAENLLQHAEHYFRLISAAQQQTNGYGRQSYETDVDYEEDDDFSAIPDRFAPLSERLPPGPGAYQAPQPAFQPPQPQAQPQPQPHFIQPQPQPQPFEERPFEPRHERPVRSERPPFGGRGRSHERSVVDRHQDADASEGGDRASHFGFDRSRERGRFPPRREPPAAPVEQPPAPEPMSSAVGLPAFITAPPTISVTRAAPPEVEAPPAPQAEAPSNEQPGRGGYHLAPRRRRKPRAQASEGADESPASSELPLGD